MYILNIKIYVSPLKKNEFHQAVTYLLESLARLYEKDMDNSISEDVCVPNTFIYTEEWKSEDEDKMRAHFHQDDFRSLIGAMKALGTIIDAKLSSSNVIENFNLNL